MLRRSIRLSVIYTLEAVAVLLTLAIFAVGALLVRLSNGPIELDFLREDAQKMLAQAFEGELVALGALEARFDPETRALVILARDVTVAESHGEVIARAPRLEAGFAVQSLLFGQVEPVTVSISGGSISIVRRADGAVGVGLGSVERVSATARLPARGGDDSASLFQLLQEPARPGGMLGELRHVDIENASVRIIDGITGIAWLVDAASVVLDRDDSRIRAELAGQLATPSGFAPLEVRIQAGAALNTLLLEARVSELSPAAIAPANGPLSVLRVLDAPVSLDLLLNATRESGIRGASINLDIGAGNVIRDGESTAFTSGRIRMDFDPDAAELTLSEARVVSDVFTAELSAGLDRAGAGRGGRCQSGKYPAGTARCRPRTDPGAALRRDLTLGSRRWTLAPQSASERPDRGRCPARNRAGLLAGPAGRYRPGVDPGEYSGRPLFQRPARPRY